MQSAYVSIGPWGDMNDHLSDISCSPGRGKSCEPAPSPQKGLVHLRNTRCVHAKTLV